MIIIIIIIIFSFYRLKRRDELFIATRPLPCSPSLISRVWFLWALSITKRKGWSQTVLNMVSVGIKHTKRKGWSQTVLNMVSVGIKHHKKTRLVTDIAKH